MARCFLIGGTASLTQTLPVQALPVIENPRGILAFDFDGTLHWPAHDPPVDPRLCRRIEELREREGMIWGICTGRSLMHLVEGMTGQLPFLPDFVVAREREIYFPGRFGRFVPDPDWNKRCEKDHKRLFKKVRKQLKEVRRYVEETALGRWVEVEGDLAGVVLPHEDEMEGLLAEVGRVCGTSPLLAYERNGVYLRFSHRAYSKGSALQEIARRVSLGAEAVFPAGDNFNDLSMLSSEVTARPLCPQNAVEEVKAFVLQQGGVVGEGEASRGVLAALEEVFAPVERPVPHPVK
ncbi:HAD-IIB family hydrolase [Roseibacillus ishigakijimensis]|uniref:HAD-IIB family hydrolase n=1 Tax=Roseibacillus ishigakijimensis TaxID=454146 RepID=A0A934RUA2_9BACT|nr:HAD-IIB family hydrolase [Roseibacillus ishigakijimensis]MBK1835543.1 HAD-IIB family hydrolase [Roseibacillus ishigakijimensis]